MKLDELSINYVFTIACLHQVLGFENFIDLATTAATCLDFFAFSFTLRFRLANHHSAKQVNKSFLPSV